jgi:hypothetical protein
MNTEKHRQLKSYEYFFLAAGVSAEILNICFLYISAGSDFSEMASIAVRFINLN